MKNNIVNNKVRLIAGSWPDAWSDSKLEDLCCRILLVALLMASLPMLLSCSSIDGQSDSLFERQSASAVDWGEHKVKKGESLYSIAWLYKRDYQALAKLNKIAPPYLIQPGQLIRLGEDINEIPSKMGYTGQTIVSGTSVANNSQAKTRRPASRKTTSSQNKAKKTPVRKPGYSKQKATKITWRWPANGKVIQNFSSKTVGKKGIEISGKKGSSVKAAASGDVVYSGNGLVGYGNLVIVKHNVRYLTAYAHNSKVLVKEGDPVKAGQKIAEMGSSGTDRDKLHFEIRREGKPVNPVSFLPRR